MFDDLFKRERERDERDGDEDGECCEWMGVRVPEASGPV